MRTLTKHSQTTNATLPSTVARWVANTVFPFNQTTTANNDDIKITVGNLT